VYLRITGCIVLPMKKPKRNTANAMIHVDLSTSVKGSNLPVWGRCWGKFISLG
jgi:hypothetical protein